MSRRSKKSPNVIRDVSMKLPSHQGRFVVEKVLFEHRGMSLLDVYDKHYALKKPKKQRKKSAVKPVKVDADESSSEEDCSSEEEEKVDFTADGYVANLLDECVHDLVTGFTGINLRCPVISPEKAQQKKKRRRKKKRKDTGPFAEFSDENLEYMLGQAQNFLNKIHRKGKSTDFKRPAQPPTIKKSLLKTADITNTNKDHYESPHIQLPPFQPTNGPCLKRYNDSCVGKYRDRSHEIKMDRLKRSQAKCPTLTLSRSQDHFVRKSREHLVETLSSPQSASLLTTVKHSLSSESYKNVYDIEDIQHTTSTTSSKGMSMRQLMEKMPVYKKAEKVAYKQVVELNFEV